MRSSSGSIDVRLLFAAIAVVAVLVILVVSIIRQARSGRGITGQTRVLAFAAGVILVASIALIGVAILN